MTSSPSPQNGDRPHPTVREDRLRKGGFAQRLAAWVVDVAIPKLLPDHVVAPLRRRLRDADDRLERSARRLTHRDLGRLPTDPDAESR
jgi:hypothetical protein